MQELHTDPLTHKNIWQAVVIVKENLTFSHRLITIKQMDIESTPILKLTMVYQSWLRY
jgi:hypothetical protein